jgi:hypothetical protein
MMEEGISLWSMRTGIWRNAGIMLSADAGQAFAEYRDKMFRNLTCKRMQVD